MVLEVQHDLDPTLLWPVKVIQNVGGRLLLSYVGGDEVKTLKFWLFYLDYRLQPLGHGKAEEGCKYAPPKGTNMCSSCCFVDLDMIDVDLLGLRDRRAGGMQ